MLSQLKLVAAAAALLIFAVSAARADQAPVAVKGTGLPRSEQDCLASLPAFKNRLAAMGLKLAAPLVCEEVLGENDTFAPSFTVVSPQPAAAVTALGQLYPNRGACEKTLEWMQSHAIDGNEALIEGACLEVSVTDQYEDEFKGGQFQPMLVLLRNKARVPATVDCKFSSAGAECVAEKSTR